MTDNRSIDSSITELNRDYLDLHQKKEKLFWNTKMGMSKDYESFNQAESNLNAFRSDMARLELCRRLLESGEADERQSETLKGWICFFEANVIEDEEARVLSKKIVEMESALAQSRSGMKLGYADPESGDFHTASSVELALKISTAEDETLREACFRGLESIESHVLKNGFIEVVKARNDLARRQGYEDYYDYKVSTTEGFSKKQLFKLLDDLETRSRDAAATYVQSIGEEKGETTLKPWNFRHSTQGDAIRDLDPYMQFSDALMRWGRSFAALGISYEGATLKLDLIDRQGKYENGFCHAPTVPFEDEKGRVLAEVNFTSNAVPGQMGSGKRAAETLFHEGGHAAHFSNMLMGAPCFSQEFAPTSAAFAETQSMFLDSLIGDADWLTRYGRDEEGNPTPWEVIEKSIRLSQPARTMFLRSLMMICYAEKALYEMKDEELTPENIMATFIDIERRLGILNRCPRPTLAVPHLLLGEASCIYHGYVLALAGVAQTRHYFLDRYGYLTDNAEIGPRLREIYWRPGNSITFMDFLERMTGKPFSMDALVHDVTLSVENELLEQKAKVDRIKNIQPFERAVKLDCTLSMVHGDQVIASTSNDSFEAVCTRFQQWILSLERG